MRMRLPLVDWVVKMPKRYGIDLSAALEKFEIERGDANQRNARWTFLTDDGKLLPVTNLYDSDGNEITNPFHAVTCVAFDATLPEQQWAVYRVNGSSGEIWERFK